MKYGDKRLKQNSILIFLWPFVIDYTDNFQRQQFLMLQEIRLKIKQKYIHSHPCSSSKYYCVKDANLTIWLQGIIWKTLQNTHGELISS